MEHHGKMPHSVDNVSTTSKDGITVKERLSYGLGDFSSNLVWGLIGSYLLFFYTNVALIPVAATGTLFLIARSLDAVIDPVIGGFVDHTNTKMGRTIPYMRLGIIPLAIVFVLTFSYFPGSDTMKIVYAYVTYIIVRLLYSLVNVPYGSLMTLMARDSGEKAKLSSFRVAAAAIGSIAVTGLTMPLVNALGHGSQRTGFVLTSALFALIAIIGFEIVSRNCKERYIDSFSEKVQSKHRAGFIATYRNAFRNKAWVTNTIYALLLFIRIGVTVAITIYFATYVLKAPALISVLLPLLYVGQLISTLFSAKMISKFGHRNSNLISQTGQLLSYLILPFLEHNIPAFLIVYLAGNVIGAVSASSVFGMNADAVDYNEWKFGVRSEGTLYAGYSFATKVGMAIGSALAGYALSWIDFNPKHITATVITNLNVLFYALPAILTILMIITVSFYKLDKMHEQIVTELNEVKHEA